MAVVREPLSVVYLVVVYLLVQQQSALTGLGVREDISALEQDKESIVLVGTSG